MTQTNRFASACTTCSTQSRQCRRTWSQPAGMGEGQGRTAVIDGDVIVVHLLQAAGSSEVVGHDAHRNANGWAGWLSGHLPPLLSLHSNASSR